MPDTLDLQDVTLAGFSMGGGKIAKYFSKHAGARVSKVVLVSAVVPYMLQKADNPKVVPQEASDKMVKAMVDDRPGFLEAFNKEFYRVGLINHPVSEAYLNSRLNNAMDASPIATIEYAKAVAYTDFRNDVLKIDVPTPIIHGDKDNTVSLKATGEESFRLITRICFKSIPRCTAWVVVY